MLPIDLAEISHEESVFVAGLAGIKIDTVDSLHQSSPNELLGGDIRAIFLDFKGIFGILEIMIDVVLDRWGYEWEVRGR